MQDYTRLDQISFKHIPAGGSTALSALVVASSLCSCDLSLEFEPNLLQFKTDDLL